MARLLAVLEESHWAMLVAIGGNAACVVIDLAARAPQSLAVNAIALCLCVLGAQLGRQRQAEHLAQQRLAEINLASATATRDLIVHQRDLVIQANARPSAANHRLN